MNTNINNNFYDNLVDLFLYVFDADSMDSDCLGSMVSKALNDAQAQHNNSKRSRKEDLIQDIITGQTNIFDDYYDSLCAWANKEPHASTYDNLAELIFWDLALDDVEFWDGRTDDQEAAIATVKEWLAMMPDYLKWMVSEEGKTCGKFIDSILHPDGCAPAPAEDSIDSSIGNWQDNTDYHCYCGDQPSEPSPSLCDSCAPANDGWTQPTPRTMEYSAPGKSASIAVDGTGVSNDTLVGALQHLKKTVDKLFS